MQRPIKFRAWDKERKVFLHSDEYCEGFFAHVECTPKKFSDVMQFTGLLDRNSKEIYEGDILDDGYGGQFFGI